MRSYVQQTSKERLIAEMGAGAADIAEIVPNIRGKVKNLETPPALEPESARFRLFDSITTFLKNASQSQPLMLVLDDLHWADRSSLLLLESLARELGDSRILLVGCYRDIELSRQHPLAETLARLSREPVFRRQLLGGLGQEELGQFIEATTGVEVSQEMTGTLYAHTEGNPFFMTEVIRLLSESGDLSASHIGTLGNLKIPEGVREVVGQRLNRLSEQCNEVLTTASIIGREFSFKLLISLNDTAPEDLVLEAIEEALAAHVIEEASATIGGYQFTHALIRETLSQELSATRRARLHAQVSEALEAMYGDNAEIHASELAYHFGEAEAVLGTEKLVRYSLLAGERALATYAYEDALAHFQRALAAKNGSISEPVPASDSDTAAILFGMGHAQVALNQVEEAVSSLSRAFDYYVESEDVSRAISIAQNSHSTVLIYGLRDVIARAIQIVPPDSIQAGHILANHGYCLGITFGSYDLAQGAFDRALSIARVSHDTALEMRILANSANIDGFHLLWQSCLAKSTAALELAPGVNDPYPKIRAEQQVYLASLSANGDLETARTHAGEIRSAGEKLRDAVWLPRAFYYDIYLFCITGDWSSARQINDQGIALFPTDPILLGQRALLEHQVGDVTLGEDYLRRCLNHRDAETPTTGVSTSAILARISWITGKEALFEIIQDESFSLLSSSPTPSRFFFARCNLALMAAQKGDVQLAGELYPALFQQQGTFAVTNEMAVDRLLGLLSKTMNDFDQAADHFEQAAGFCRKAGYRPELAWTCYDYADVLQERDGEGDRIRVMSLLDESLAISSELGMRPLQERASSRRESLEA